MVVACAVVVIVASVVAISIFSGCRLFSDILVNNECVADEAICVTQLDFLARKEEFLVGKGRVCFSQDLGFVVIRAHFVAATGDATMLEELTVIGEDRNTTFLLEGWRFLSHRRTLDPEGEWLRVQRCLMRSCAARMRSSSSVFADVTWAASALWSLRRR